MDRSVDSKSETKKRMRHFDRVTLNRESLEKLDKWIKQIAETNKGICLTRNDLINWLINNQSEIFTSQQLDEIQDKFYDPVKYARWALIQVKEAQARGEKVTVKILDGPEALSVVRSKRSYKKRIEKSDKPTSMKEVRLLEDELMASSDEPDV